MSDYRYYGNRATAVCANGHFGVRVIDMKCKECGLERKNLDILTLDGEYSVKINGYLSGVPDTADVRFQPFVYEDVHKDDFLKRFEIPGVNDPQIVVGRLFAWGIVTI